ncbi:hypothetical protein I4U23_020079 [Adineta vaga]|nr:hypothetical protein I4U23_020079 [Adineta vaga]
MKTKSLCYQCGQPGHIARLCPQKNYELKVETRTSQIGHQRSHLEHAYDRNLFMSVQCFQCGWYGHFARDCTMKTKRYCHKNAKTTAKNQQQSLSSTTIPKAIHQTNAATSSTQNHRIRKDIIQNVSNDRRLTTNRRNRNTNLEALANELLFNVFEYLSTGHLLNAFHDLNSHFDTLLFAHFRVCHLDFQAMLQSNLKQICQRYLSLIKDRMASVRISDQNHKMKQTQLLSLNSVNLRHFNHLRSITLCHISSEQRMNKIMTDWSYLNCLTRLKIIKCHSSFPYRRSIDLSNIIWSLPKLTHIYLDTDYHKFYMPEIRSLSIEYVGIVGHCSRLEDIVQLIKKTTSVRGLCISHRDLNDDQYFTSPILSITTLKLYDIHSREVLMNLLQTMINLCHLTVETYYLNLDGYQWEQIITQYLPKLQVFRLKMDIQLTGKRNNEQEDGILLDSFRHRFWLEEHRWYVRCHRKSQHNYSDILIYTPLLFNNVNTNTVDCPFKSTCPSDRT